MPDWAWFLIGFGGPIVAVGLWILGAALTLVIIDPEVSVAYFWPITVPIIILLGIGYTIIGIVNRRLTWLRNYRTISRK